MGRPEEAGYSLEHDAETTRSSGIPSGLEHHPYSDDMQLALHTPIDTTPIPFSPPPVASTSQTPITQPWTRFAIPTKTSSLSSGFPFHPRLYHLRVTHDQWHLFTSDIVTAAKMTPKEDYLAWTTGITSGTLSSPFVLILAPWVGYYSGKAVHKKTLVKTVKEKLGEEGGLRAVLRKWNDNVFRGMGFQAWLELPRESGEMIDDKTLDLGSEITHKDEKERKKVEKKAARRFRIILVPNSDLEFDQQQVAGNGVVGATSSVGSETSSVRGPEGQRVVEMGNHRETLPPAYWDANDVGNVVRRDTTGSEITEGEGTMSSMVSSDSRVKTTHDARDEADSGVSPIDQEISRAVRDHREAPLDKEIRYSRDGGFTNS